MEENARYVSPIYNERVDQEEFVSVCMDILRNARNEIYLSMRFLDVALSSLYFAPDLSVRGIATDGSGLFFEPATLARMYRKSRVLVNRTYLHAILHCLFCHMWNRKKGPRIIGIWPVTLRSNQSLTVCTVSASISRFLPQDGICMAG